MLNMSDEKFPNSMLKRILFEIKYPSLFYLESRIGDYQIKIIDKFPQSSLLYRQQVVFADMGPNIKQEEVLGNLDKNFRKKIWQFKSESAEINITNNSLDISSVKIKTYKEKEGFRPLVEYVLNNFLSIATIPEFKRIGLRYINEFPLHEKNNIYINKNFKTTFPIKRFKLENSTEQYYRSTNKIKDINLTFQEGIRNIENKFNMILDIDAFKENFKSDNYLQILDDLHTTIKSEFFNSVKQPIIKLMRKKT